MTGILVEIPYHVTYRRQFGPIHTKFHDYSMPFIHVLFFVHAKTSHGFWTKVQAIEFP